MEDTGRQVTHEKNMFTFCSFCALGALVAKGGFCTACASGLAPLPLAALPYVGTKGAKRVHVCQLKINLSPLSPFSIHTAWC